MTSDLKSVSTWRQKNRLEVYFKGTMIEAIMPHRIGINAFEHYLSNALDIELGLNTEYEWTEVHYLSYTRTSLVAGNRRKVILGPSIRVYVETMSWREEGIPVRNILWVLRKTIPLAMEATSR